jgi:hypothetical protein
MVYYFSKLIELDSHESDLIAVFAIFSEIVDIFKD